GAAFGTHRGDGSGRSAAFGTGRCDRTCSGAGLGSRRAGHRSRRCTCRSTVNCYDDDRSGSGCPGINASDDRCDSSTGWRDRAADDARARAG
ncbi:MAG: hypothetical protein ABSD51_10840, partial [Candidatus Binatus sp.]